MDHQRLLSSQPLRRSLSGSTEISLARPHDSKRDEEAGIGADPATLGLPLKELGMKEEGYRTTASLIDDGGSSWGNLQSLEEGWRQWKATWHQGGLSGIAARWKTTRVHHLLSAVTRRASLIPPRRRALMILASLFLFLFLLFRRRIPNTSARTSLAVLSGSGYSAAIVDRTTGLHRGLNKGKVLESYSNPYGYINLVDPYAGGVYNPSILILPDTIQAGFRHLLVARGGERFEVIDGEDTRWQTVFGCFLLPLKRKLLELPYLARESDLWALKLPAQRKMDFLRCRDPVFDQFIGPEDPRLFFTNIGQPLIVFSQTGRTPNICRGIFIIDARVVIPGLQNALAKAGWNPPIEFTEQTDLIREDQTNIEKNWSPFLGDNDELFFHISLVPQQIYKYVPHLPMRALDPAPPSHNCLTDVVGAQMGVVKMHHATPLLRATLCRRGECVPDVHNTVLFGMVHVKYHPEPYLFYERRIVTWNVTSPYEYVSVSKPLSYSGTNQADPIFTVSMAWDHPTDRHGLGLNHGFLDEVVVTSFGVFDYGSAYIDILARDLLSDHTICGDTRGPPSLW